MWFNSRVASDARRIEFHGPNSSDVGAAPYAVTFDEDARGRVWRYAPSLRRWRLLRGRTQRDMLPDFPGDFGAEPGRPPISAAEARALVDQADKQYVGVGGPDPWQAAQPSKTSEQLGLALSE
jgi:hypothetical protein